MCPTYDYRCPPCENISIVFSPYEERDSQVCPLCRGALVRQLHAPHSPRASYVDGQRGRTGNWKDMREASKLNRAAGDAKDSDRKAIKDEIKKIGVRVEK